jgi:uncharacterized protein (DUF111 family)
MDAMLAPVTMKKGRSGTWLVIVCEPTVSERLAEMILAGTTTLGVRHRQEGRLELERTKRTVSTPMGDVEIKVATLPDGGFRAQPEYESVRAAAERSGRSLREVSEAAVAAWRAAGGQRPS